MGVTSRSVADRTADGGTRQGRSARPRLVDGPSASGRVGVAGSAPLTAVALRSADPALVDAVRTVAALADLPLSVHPPGADAPRAALVLDSVHERRAADPEWRTGPRFAWVAVERPDSTPDGAPCLVLPEAGAEVLARLRAVSTTRRARVIGVVGASGGAGASSLAAVLARCCAEARTSPALVDLAADGGGLDLLTGTEHEAGLRWSDLHGETSGFGPAELSASLPLWRGVRLLAGEAAPLGTGVRDAALAALADAHDVVVLDLPRVRAQDDGEAVRWCETVVVVARCDVRSAAGAQVAARALTGLDARLVVRGPSPGGLRAVEIAAATGLPLLAEMAAERSLAAALERGVAPGDQRRGPLLRAGRAIVAALELT